GKDVETRNEVGELVFHRKFRVFTKNRINLNSSTFGPITVSGGRFSGETQVPITVVGEVVTADGEVVTAPTEYNLLSASENFYCTLVQLSPTIKYVFGKYNNTVNPVDWQALTPID